MRDSRSSTSISSLVLASTPRGSRSSAGVVGRWLSKEVVGGEDASDASVVASSLLADASSDGKGDSLAVLASIVAVSW